jgi:hypothetical protein
MASDLRKTILDPADVIQAEVEQLLAEMQAMSPKELTSRAKEMRDRMVGLIRRQGELAERLSRTLAARNMQPSRGGH